MNLLITLLLMIMSCYVHNSQCADTENAKRYLLKYGYLDTFSVGDEVLKASIKRLQYFANLKQTGVLDAATQKQMTIPRCAHSDPKIKITRARRYVHQGTRWRKSLLTWRLEGRGRTLSRSIIRRVMSKAMGYWSRSTNINFKETASSKPDIWVKFTRYHHGDPYSFDGPGGTLAHAFYPHNNQGLSGDIHFDDDENYTYQSSRGRNLLWVATHELGHSLGLEHSNLREAVMYPWYTKYKANFKLHNDDVHGIQALYGKRKNPTSRRPTRPTRPIRPISNNKKCPQAGVTAIFYSKRAKSMVALTKNKKLYFVNNKGIKYGPVSTSNYFPKSYIPQAIDAAFNIKIRSKEYTIVFSQRSYYLFHKFRYISGPHSIHRRTNKEPLNLRFPNSVKKIDAALIWQRNKRIYFFSGPYYWRYNNKNNRLDSGYPKRISRAWRGLPEKIDAAYSSSDGKHTFFVSGKHYYLFNDKNVRVKRGYPEHVGREWLNCSGRSMIRGGIGFIAVGGIRVEDGKADEP
ncbi:matrix metalloproteinase-24-like [Hydractinia symbiolongicarpus]|uniref:matrix metalloproteinase-24-like n=1 Tax=Hydractinia symbiolongicarpus TaxID=13093 RepID=UPI002549DEAC|nr:matrix metalloproteinase-24-like [Hydractinia symbiolongicarpus]